MEKIKYTLVMIIGMMVITVNCQNIKKLDDKNGFRNIKFECPKDSLKNIKLVEQSADTEYFIKTDEILIIGEYKIKQITYGFYKNKLCYIILDIEGYSNSKGILAVMQELYGEGYKDNKYIEKYTWSGEKVFAVYKENSITYNSSLMFFSNLISDQKRADKIEKDKKAASGM